MHSVRTFRGRTVTDLKPERASSSKNAVLKTVAVWLLHLLNVAFSDLDRCYILHLLNDEVLRCRLILYIIASVTVGPLNIEKRFNIRG